jgi:hypothetical protein
MLHAVLALFQGPISKIEALKTQFGKSTVQLDEALKGQLDEAASELLRLFRSS